MTFTRFELEQFWVRLVFIAVIKVASAYDCECSNHILHLDHFVQHNLLLALKNKLILFNLPAPWNKAPLFYLPSVRVIEARGQPASGAVES